MGAITARVFAAVTKLNFGNTGEATRAITVGPAAPACPGVSVGNRFYR